MQKIIQFKTKGMQRDLSASAFNPEYSYENKNVRVMPTDESTLLSLINEKGNKKSGIAGVGDHIKGIPIGQALVNNELIIFAAGDDDYRLADITPNIFEAPDIFPCDVLITNLTAGKILQMILLQLVVQPKLIISSFVFSPFLHPIYKCMEFAHFQ